MTTIVQNNEKILVWFDIQDGLPCVEIDDANYVRAGKVLYDTQAHCLYAVLHDGLFLIGKVPAHFREDYSKASCVILKSALPNGADIQMKATVGSFVIQGCEKAKKEEAFELLPVFAAAGHAMCGIVKVS